MDYESFIKGKHRRTDDVGIDVDESEINPKAFDFQRAIIRWALRKGRSAIFADCGLGKSLMMLDWCRVLIEGGHAKRALILCPCAVGPQMEREACKFGIDVDCRVVSDSSEVRSGINITNYEKLHKFDTSAFDVVSLDESSILKSYAGKTKRMLCDAFRDTRYKLACTATPAPNDHMELGNQCDYLGVMPSNEMLSRWFINDTMKAGGYRLAGHAAKDFWEWMATWAVSISRPSDLGFSDEGYELPSLNMIEHTTESGIPEGHLFATDKAVSATTVHVEKRASLEQKAELIASLVNGNSDQWCVWCDTNYEADAFQKLLPDAVEVRGSHSDSVKAERLMSFVNKDERVLISKPEIAGFGLNMQSCHNTTCLAGFSFERWYQLIRRFYRFGQTEEVNCHLIGSENEAGVVRVLKDKQAAAEEMSSQMVAAMKTATLESFGRKRFLADYKPSRRVSLSPWMKEKAETSDVH